jgi:predicted GIY-YIG superfamily endonuclease
MMTYRSHESWTISEEQEMLGRFKQGVYLKDIANSIGRTELAVRSRLAKLQLLPPVTAKDIERCRSRSSTRIERNETLVLPPEDSIPNAELLYERTKAFEATLDVQQAFHRFHFVYAIVNPAGKVYVGYSQDVWHRISQHNRSRGAVATRNCGPWFPFAIYCFAAEIDARLMETKVHRSFSEFVLKVEVSLREVLAQIGVPITRAQLTLI